jgi:alkylated DNA nucleotide flippase Atl1
MRAQEVTFLQLVQGEKQFQVPLYQRTYSWQEQQLATLWRDIREQAAGLTTASSRSTHFLGSVVLAPSASMQAGGVQRWLVVDGQQRLSTLMLLLAAIRDHVAADNERDADRIHRQYLVNEFRAGDDHLRLLPTQADRAAFRAHILRAASATSGDGIGTAYRFFRSALVSADDPDDDQDITRIEAVVREQLSLVEITADRGDNVYRIFESLNNTGLRLTQADLLRNYIFMLLPTRGEDVYCHVWLPMQSRLSTQQLELLVWLDLVIRGNDRVKQTEIYRAQQERLEPLERDESALEAEVVELARRARHLERIVDPAKEPDAQLRAALERLSSWGAQTAYPLVMHLLDLAERGNCTTSDVVESLSYIESFLVRRMICQVPPNNLNRVFNLAPVEVGEQTPVPLLVRRYLSGRRRYWPTETEVRKAVRTRPFYWTGRGHQRFFVLRRLEESFGAAEPVDFARAALTIEHVLPQTPTDEWLELLAPEVTDEAGPKELHDLLVHTLGNLTLTAENARLSNSPFQRKQDILQASALSMNREIAATPSWGKAEIYERADRLADRMVAIWLGPVSGEPALDEQSRDWSLLRRALAVLPAGTWTTYGDLAELIGSHPVPVGVHLATQPVPNAWRVLMSDGSVSPGFRWGDAARTESPREVLEAEGVRFAAGRADPVQRITAAELAELLGMDVGGEDRTGVVAADGEGIGRFNEQLRDDHPELVAPVAEVVAFWRSLGGELDFGRAAETSCFLMLRNQQRPELDIWPLVLYPSYGAAEVVFQHMRRRPPFDDVAVREELRRRLNDVPGIDLPEGKIALRPSFRLSALADAEALRRVKGALEWFVVTVRGHAARIAEEETGSLDTSPAETLGMV